MGSLSEGPARVLIRSIGTSGFNVIPVIAAALHVHPREAAQRILRAPSELLKDLPLDRALRIAGELRCLGLDATAEPVSNALPPPGEVHDLALAIRDVARIRDVMHAVMELLAIEPDAARDLVCREPCLLLGSVGAATASALEARFAALGCEMDISRPAQARFDLLLAPLSAPQRTRLLPALHEAGIEWGGAASAPVLVPDLDHAAAMQAWEIMQAQHLVGELRNRDFARADVILEDATPDPRLRQVLAAPPVSVPASMIDRVTRSLPVVICRQARLADAAGVLQALRACGATGRAELRAGMRCRVVIVRVGNASSSADVLRWLGAVPASEIQELLAGRAERPLRGYGPTHARWLVQELKAAGTNCRIELE